MFQTSITDLKNSWVVFKKIKKVPWYHRGGRYQVCSRYSSKAYKYQTKDEADKVAKELNINRKSYKFKVECAEKHFVNNWRLFWNNWDYTVKVISEPVDFNRVKEGTKSFNMDLNSKKEALGQEIEKMVNRTLSDRAQIEERYKLAIALAEGVKQADIKASAERMARLVQIKAAVETTDFNTEYVEKFQTDMDKKAQILFGRKENG